MSEHRAEVRRIDPAEYPQPWRVTCTCGHYRRWLFWRNAWRDAHAHTHPSFFVPAWKDTA